MSNFFNHFIAIATSVLHLVLVLTEVLGAVAVLVMMVLICKSIFKALGHAADKDKAETKKTCALEHVHESTMFALRKRLDGGIACGSPVAAGQSNAAVRSSTTPGPPPSRSTSDSGVCAVPASTMNGRMARRTH